MNGSLWKASYEMVSLELCEYGVTSAIIVKIKDANMRCPPPRGRSVEDVNTKRTGN